MIRERSDGGALARGMGWFSLGLGAAQLAAPGRVAELAGVRDDDRTLSTMRALGAREIASGLGILGMSRPAPFLWGRVAGDAMDLALLGRALNGRRADRRRVTIALALVGGAALLDLLASVRASRAASKKPVTTVRRSITVNRPVPEVEAYWRDVENLPEGAEIVEEVSGKMLAWVSPSTGWGRVRFEPAPAGRGTEVHVEMLLQAPLGRAVGKVLGKFPEEKLATLLRRFKQVVETGEVVHSDASIHRGMHPSRPPRRVPSDLPRNARLDDERRARS
jgi:uncharacterized membrane protein